MVDKNPERNIGNPTLANLTCDCCGRKDKEVVGVASSSLGAVSIAWCRECLDNRAEPAWIAHATIDGCGGMDFVRPEILDFVNVFHKGEYIPMKKWALLVGIERWEESWERQV